MTEAKDYLDFLEQHRLMDDAQKYPLVVEYARSCEAEIARLRAALEFYADPDTYKATPSGSQNSWGNYEVIDYPIGDDEGEIARAALEGRE